MEAAGDRTIELGKRRIGRNLEEKVEEDKWEAVEEEEEEEEEEEKVERQREGGRTAGGRIRRADGRVAEVNCSSEGNDDDIRIVQREGPQQARELHWEMQ